ncbi:MAG: WYL domain-containing protein, partial [Clostridia bacterium]|nr:WYL domain-containing protein [Clostridia bacterium]
YSDNAERIELITDNAVIDAIIDCFGKDICIRDLGNSRSKIQLKSSVMAMEHYAMQYIDHVEIVKPLCLREKIKEKILKGLNKYEN